MKKKLFFAISAFLLSHFCIAQTATTPVAPTPTVQTPAPVQYGYYVAKGDIEVYPYISDATTPTDKNIHFLIRKGVKFTIEKPVPAADGKSNVGYVIKIVSFVDPGGIKKTFYNSLLTIYNQKAPGIETKKADLISKKEVIDAKATDSAATAKKAASLQESLATIQTMLAVDSEKIIKTAKQINPKTLAVPLTVKNKKFAVTPEVNKFISAQSQINSGQSSTTVKANLVTAVLNLPNIPDTALLSARAAYNNNKYHYDAFSKSLKATLQEISDKTAGLVKLRNDYKLERAEASANEQQIDDSKVDADVYKTTKEQKGQTYVAPPATDPVNAYAPYADLAYLDSWANDWTFYMDASDFSNSATSLYPRSFQFTWGFLTLPLKLRFDNSLSGGRFNFEQNLNFGLTVGFKQELQGTNDVSWNYLAGLSVVNVPLNDATPAMTTTTIPASGSSTTATTPATAASSTAAVSLSFGTMFQYSKFQIGVFLGWDFAGTHAYQFAYQGKPWLGFAIGLSLFGAGQTTPGTQTQN